MNRTYDYNQTENPELRNVITKICNSINKLIGKLDIVEKMINELEERLEEHI